MSLTTRTTKVPLGMRKSYFAPIASEASAAHPTYGAAMHMGAAVKGYLSITSVVGDIPADDVIQVHSERFVSAQADVETDCSDLELNAGIYGHTFATDVETSAKDDEPPCGAYAFIEPLLLKDKSTTFRATVLYKVCALASSEKTEADTRKNDFSPKMNAVSFFVQCDNTGAWRDRQEFSTEALADAWIRTTLSIT